MVKNKLNRNQAILLISSIILILDQVTKYFSTIYLTDSKPIIQDIFHLTLSKNYGAGFNLLENQQVILIFLALVIIGTIVYYLDKVPNILYLIVSISAILGGAVGNLIDRIRLGYVIDFIDFQVWPVFNVADSAITVAGIFLAIYFWKKSNH